MDLTLNPSSDTSLVLHGLCSALPRSSVQAFHSYFIQQPTRSLTLPVLIRCLQVSIVVLLFLEIKQAFITFYAKAPRNAHIVGPSTLAGRWLTGLVSGYRGDEMLRRGYEKTKALGGLFAVPTLGRYIVYVTNQNQYEEINRASVHTLSLGGMIHDRIYPNVIMDGLTESDYTTASSNAQYVLKRRLRSKLPVMHKMLREGAAQSIDVGFGVVTEDWKEVHLYSSMTKVFLNLNNYMLVGESLARQPGYLETAMEWSEHATMAEELLQFLPSFLAPVADVVMHWHHSKDKFMAYLLPLVEKRLREQRGDLKTPEDERNDAAAWMIEKMNHRSPLCIARHLMALTFAATHQPPMLLMFTLYNLCKHPQYLEPLRQEALQASSWECDNQNTEMPLLDSFIKETARMEPGSLMGVGRRANIDFTFRDGTHVPAGNFVAVNHYQMQRNAASYADPDNFDGFRFVDAEGASRSRLTHGSWDFTFWGSTKQGCPARFYVSVAMKLFLTHVLLNYDVKLMDAEAPSRWNLGFMQFPNARQRLLVRKRSG